MVGLRGLIKLERVSSIYPAHTDELVYREGMISFPSAWMLAWCRFSYRCCQSGMAPNVELELMVNLVGATVLHYAVLQGEARAVETLLRRGASVDAANADGRTPLMLAAMGGHTEIAQLLLSSGARTDLADAWGLNAAAWASRRGHAIVNDVLEAAAAAATAAAAAAAAAAAEAAEAAEAAGRKRPTQQRAGEATMAANPGSPRPPLIWNGRPPLIWNANPGSPSLHAYAHHGAPPLIPTGSPPAPEDVDADADAALRAVAEARAALAAAEARARTA